MKFLRWFIQDVRKNVLTQRFLWGISIFMAIELFALGVYYEHRAAVERSSAGTTSEGCGVP